MKKVARFLAEALLHTPYRWGGDDPLAGFDCSGMVVFIGQCVGAIGTGDWTAAELFDLLPNVDDKLEEFDLLFWENRAGKIVHVEFIYDMRLNLSIGAGGGGSGVTTINDAIQQNAFVRIRPWKNDYREIAGTRVLFTGERLLG